MGSLTDKICPALCAGVLALYGVPALAQLGAFGVEVSTAGQVLQLDYGESIQVEPFPLNPPHAANATSPLRLTRCVVDHEARAGCKGLWDANAAAARFWRRPGYPAAGR